MSADEHRKVYKRTIVRKLGSCPHDCLVKQLQLAKISCLPMCRQLAVFLNDILFGSLQVGLVPGCILFYNISTNAGKEGPEERSPGANEDLPRRT